MSPILLTPPSVDGYSEGRRWDTDTFRAHDGTETRVSRFSAGDTAKRFVNFPMRSISAHERRWIENNLSGGLKGTIEVPLWYSRTDITSTVTMSTTIFCTAPDQREFIVGQNVVLLKENQAQYKVDDNFQVREVATILGDRITVTASADGFAVGDLVIPLIDAAPQPEWTAEGIRDSVLARFVVPLIEIR